MTSSLRSRRRAWVLAGIFGWVTAVMLIAGFCVDIALDDPVSAIVEGFAIITFAVGWVCINRLVDHATGLKRALTVLVFRETIESVPTQNTVLTRRSSR